MERTIHRILLRLDDGKYDEIAEEASINAQVYAFKYYNSISKKTFIKEDRIIIDIR